MEQNILKIQPMKATPAVPTPDWNSYNTSTNISSRENRPPQGEFSRAPSIVSDSSVPAKAGDSSNQDRMTVVMTPQSRISGEVALTPTHSTITSSHNLNPHASMNALTPMLSGPHQAKSSVKLQNCVSTVSLGCELKLLDIYCRTRFSEYNPSRFHGVIMRILEPRATALVFRSGKVVCTGARNEHDSYIAARKFARIIQKLGFPAKFLDFKIQNFVATADLRFPVRLEALQQAHGQFTSYEPELFPGLVYRMVRPRIVLLIFVNGKIVFTGGKTRNDITEALDRIYPILRSFRKN